jgi:acetyltransferase
LTVADARPSALPYPRDLERKLTVPGLGEALLRPIRPADAAALVRLFDRLAPEDVRMRFFAPIHELSPNQLAHFSRIDYDREMAFVLEIQDRVTGAELASVVRLAADPDKRQAEFAALVRSDLQRKGVGKLMMEQLIDYARRRGIGELFGDILEDNQRMRALARALGFEVAALGPGVVRATLRL